MKSEPQTAGPEHTAVRVALWRALHLEIDPSPHVFTDSVGAKIVNETGWRNRPDMNPDFSKPMRASIIGRARFIEDLLEDEIKKGVVQYVILGAGIDTLAQRRPELSSRIKIFEVDQPGPQQWKQARLKEMNLMTKDWPVFVPVNFESESWWEKLLQCGLDPKKKTFVASTGVSMYLTRDANRATFTELSQLASGSVFAMTFMLSLDLLSPQERGIMEFVMKRAAESGTPFLSLFRPEEVGEMARSEGFSDASYVSAETIFQKYFAARPDGLRAGNAEAFIVSRV